MTPGLAQLDRPDPESPRLPQGAGRLHPVPEVCPLPGGWRGFLQRVGMCGGWGRAALAGCGWAVPAASARCVACSHPAHTWHVWREVTPRPSPLSPRLAHRGNSPGLALSPLGQCLQEPRKVPVPSGRGVGGESQARSFLDPRRLGWENGLSRAARPVCCRCRWWNSQGPLGVFLSVSDARHLHGPLGR